MATQIFDAHDEPFVDGSAAIDEQRLAAGVPPGDQNQDPSSDEVLGQRAAATRATTATRATVISARVAGHVLGVALLIIAAGMAGGLVPPAMGASVPQLLTICVGLLVCTAMTSRGDVPRVSARRATRVAVIGSQPTAVTLKQDLVYSGITAYECVGWIAPTARHRSLLPMPAALGPISELASLVERHRIDLLLVGSDVPRLDVFDELVRLTDVVGVRACELSAFYEDAFRRIPVAEINSTWFQYVMHPKYNPTRSNVKRAFDVTVASGLMLVTLPMLLVAAVCIKFDGGSLLYRQRRIGEKGRPFTMYKLRTMRECQPEREIERWCSVDDPRVTPVGRVLRRLHIDELPQLYNILRGEMSIVGPRPEQPAIVARLEAAIAFYSRRHLIKPGLAGWAQLHCGYARSERGSAWKLCHDLYYLKHQSLRLDLMILARTIFSLVLPEPGDAALPPDVRSGGLPLPERASVSRG